MLFIPFRLAVLFPLYLAAGGPQAYLFPASFSAEAAKLGGDSAEVSVLREDVELEVEEWRAGGSPAPATRRFEAGTIILKTPEAPEALAGRLDRAAARPIVRLLSRFPLAASPVEARDGGTEMRPITFERIYASPDPPRFGGSPVGGLRWLRDGRHFLQVKDGRLFKVEAATGRAQPFHDPEVLAAALARLPSIDAGTARRLATQTSFDLSPAEDGFVFQHQNDLYRATFDGKTAVRLTSTPAREEVEAQSPDGRFVAFVRENDLWVVDLATSTERALTTGGSDKLRSGKADWVYYEEVFDRSWRAFWWSGDSERIAFLRIDSSPVREFTVPNDLESRQVVERTPYPKPGEPNPRVEVGVVTVAGGPVTWADLSDYDEGGFLVTGAGFRPDGALCFFVQNRTQSWLDIRVLEPGARRPRLLLRETTAGWVDPPPEPIFLDDGGFVLASERDGYRHLYRHSGQGTEAARLTSGDWEVRTVHALDRRTGWIYFSATRDDPIAENLYRVRLDGSGLERLTTEPGSHSIDLDPTAGAFLDTWSDFQTPPRVALHRADGARIRMIDSNPVPALERYRFGSLERLHIRLADGFVLEGTLLKPPDFDPRRKYPVWYETYAGPRTPTIRDSFYGGRTWDQVLAAAGILVLHCDPRSASGKGAAAAYSAYRRLGVKELQDIGEAIEWLCQRPYVDRARIGMSGVSYGGFMTAYAMTHSRLFAAGIAGAPVTDWRDYDSIYTEKYMLTPEENPEGYRVSSVVAAAKDLHGRLLLIHGAIDDNVHLQNTLRLARALQDDNKRFDIMIYPPNRHGFGSPHYQRTMYEFILKSLGVPMRRRV